MNAREEVNRIDQANEVADVVYAVFKEKYPEVYPPLGRIYSYGIADRLYELGYRKVES